ncbi:Piso0_004791 [Millerozyma farinosa CBS 7064]|uniref:Piso0_004791 protein n=1 Tax=Pichia sorbitophila (strain ATCC MYA-4447 / BCRC 22081 / CBS 7064 / NBRC 10061 / NRRL Y-12695) TaxID=559304 RepID=G8Y3E1_PICSO|nr:Piso0_004791 [Millerozyma farinosa CBS 7064]
MSHPEASIKSIYSGKLNLASADIPDISDYVTSGTKERTFRDNEDLVSFSSRESSSSVGSKRIKSHSVMTPPQDTPRSLSYSNLSDASLGSEPYQNGLSFQNINQIRTQQESDNSVESNVGTNGQEPFTRPKSATSTTSCLSTTATKDGIEGKKVRKQGLPYLLKNNVGSFPKNADPTTFQFAQEGFESPSKSLKSAMNINAVCSPSDSPLNHFYGQELSAVSQSSFRSTAAEMNGETGDDRNLQFQRATATQPPVSLNEKINLISIENVKPDDPK